MKTSLAICGALAALTLSSPAWALGEYNDGIESACGGHSVRMIVPNDMIERNQTVSMHPDPEQGRRLSFLDDQRWQCKMRRGSMLFGTIVDGWGGTYRILPELNSEGTVIVLSPTVSPNNY